MISADDARSLLGAYALDAVDAEERAAVEALVATDPAAARELASLLAVSASLGAAVAADPPPDLRAVVLAAAAGKPQVDPLAGTPQSDRLAETLQVDPLAGTLQVDPLAGTLQSDPLAGTPQSDPLAGTPQIDPPDDPLDGPVAVPVGDEPAAGSSPAQADASSSGPAPSGVTDLASRRRPTTRWLAVAAAVVIGAAVPTALAVQQAQRADHAEQQQQALADLLTDPSAVVVHGTMPGGGAATAVLTDSQALISASDMPDPGAGHVYQLWVVSDGAASSAGILAEGGGSARALTEDFAAGDSLAVTVEPSGGSTQPTTTPVLVLSAT